MRRTSTVGLAFVTSLMGVAASAHGQIKASATITRDQLGPTSFQYSLTLTDTGTTPIGTFWFGWVPGYDLLPHAPTSIASPTGWTGQNAPDAFGVASAQWVNTTSPLQPGKSLSGFTFDTTDSNITTGTSLLGLPTDQSYVYIGAPETDAGFTLRPTVVTPEPTSVALLAIPAAALFVRRRRTR